MFNNVDTNIYRFNIFSVRHVDVLRRQHLQPRPLQRRRPGVDWEDVQRHSVTGSVRLAEKDEYVFPAGYEYPAGNQPVDGQFCSSHYEINKRRCDNQQLSNFLSLDALHISVYGPVGIISQTRNTIKF